MATEGATVLNIEPNPSIDSSVDENKIEQNKNKISTGDQTDKIIGILSVVPSAAEKFLK